MLADPPSAAFVVIFSVPCDTVVSPVYVLAVPDNVRVLALATVTLFNTPAPTMLPVRTWSDVDACESTAPLPMVMVPAYDAGVGPAPSVPVSEMVLVVPEIAVSPA